MSIRGRLTLVVVGLVAGTALLTALASAVLQRRALEDQLVLDGTAQATFNIGVLATLPAGADRADFEATDLVDRFAIRGADGLFVDFGDDDPYVSDLALVDAPRLLGADFEAIVETGELGYEFVDVGGRRFLAVGGRRSAGAPQLVFFFDASVVDRATTQLVRLLAGSAGVVLVVGALMARGIARRVLRPVALSGRAAQRIAAGDLAARVPVSSKDEFGRWAEAFNDMASSLEDTRTRERRFVADVSHELRTPLTGLVNEASLLEAQLDRLPAEARRPAELLVADVARLRRLVEDLLEISRLDASAPRGEPVDTDVEGFLRALVRERHPAATLHVKGLERPVACDRNGLERVVGNLLDNARVHAGGAPVEVTAQLDGHILVVEVADRGYGVQGTDVERLFDRFATGDAARSGGSGSGLGLAIARGHAERMGGSLTAGPRVGGGLAFTLRMPVTRLLPGGEAAAMHEGDHVGQHPTQQGRTP